MKNTSWVKVINIGVFPVARRILLPLLLEIYVSTILLSDA